MYVYANSATRTHFKHSAKLIAISAVQNTAHVCETERIVNKRDITCVMFKPF